MLQAGKVGDLAEGRPQLDLPDARSRTARQRDERGAGGIGPPCLAIPARPEPGDERGMSETLDILDERRPAADAALERTWRHDRRPGVALVDEVHGGRFLAGHVAIWRVDEADRH